MHDPLRTLDLPQPCRTVGSIERLGDHLPEGVRPPLGKSVTPPMCTSKLKVVKEAENTRVEGPSDRGLVVRRGLPMRRAGASTSMAASAASGTWTDDRTSVRKCRQR